MFVQAALKAIRYFLQVLKPLSLEELVTLDLADFLSKLLGEFVRDRASIVEACI